MDLLPDLVSSKNQMVAFYYGAIFVFMGAYILSQQVSSTELPLAGQIKWLGAFGLFHGSAQLLVTLIGVVGLNGLILWGHFVLEMLSLGALLEFGRRTWLIALDREEWITELRHPWGPFLHAGVLLIVVVTLLLASEPAATNQARVISFLGLAVALIAAAGLLVTALMLRERFKPKEAFVYTLLAAATMTAYAMLGANGSSNLVLTQGIDGLQLAAVNVDLVFVRSVAAVLLVVALGRIISVYNHSLRNDVLAALELESRRAKMILNAAADGILEVDKGGVIQFANSAAASMLGTEPEALVGRQYHAAIHHSHADGTPNNPGSSAILNAIRMGREHTGHNEYFFRADGSSFAVKHACIPVISDAELKGSVLTFTDITESNRTSNLLRVTQEMGHIGGWELHPDSGKVVWTDEVFRIHDLPPGTVMTTDSIAKFFHGSASDVFRQAMQGATQDGRSFDLELRLVTESDRRIWVRVIGRPQQRAGSGFVVTGTYQDVTERVHHQRKLRDNRDFYELILNSVPIRIAHINSRKQIGYANASYEEWFKTKRRDMHGKHVKEIMSPEGYAEARPFMERALAGESISFQTNVDRDGVRARLAIHYLPHISRSGEILGFFSVVQDMTEYRELEARLVQAQKMEAVGQLTGGLAHDFNNLLSVILGNLQLLERPLRADEKLHRKVKTATRAAMRGADLTRRLLAFSRRQMLEPKVVDLHRLVDNIDELIRRTLGEGIDIISEFPETLWRTMVDPSQLETAILNLAINARDAMQGGGSLRLVAGNASLDAARCRDIGGLVPGDYVSVTVMDTGCGMTQEVVRQVFEPFFTTKEVGKGSGLGLSMVYGFAEQSGGGVTVESELHMGTSVTIYLPRAESIVPDQLEETAVHRFMPGGDELILVVDDEDDVRETVIALLHELGYKTLEAANGPAALEIVKNSDNIDMLLSDVRMPGGLHGPALAKLVRKVRPDMKVMFTSGYADSNTMQSSDLVAGAEMLPKPYRNEELAIKIRLMLDKEVPDDRTKLKSSAGH